VHTHLKDYGWHLPLPARRDKMVEMDETMLNPSTKLRAGLHKDLPKAKTPHVWANG